MIEKTIRLLSLEEKLKDVFKEKKNVLIFDKQGSVDTYFQYTGVVVDMFTIPLWKRLGADIDTIYEPIRKDVVNSMRFGQTCVLNYKDVDPDFLGNSVEGMIDPQWLFHPELRAEKENHMSVIRLEETIDETGVFSLNPNFNLVVMAKYVNEEKK